MPSYKLVYFNARGRAELVRWVFKVAGVDFEDYRIKKGGWADIKPDAPFGQCPILEVDGQKYCQGVAIARYIANRYGLGGDTAEDQARVDMVVDCCQDMGLPSNAIFKEADQEKRAKMVRKYCEEQLPAFMTRLENLLRRNNGGDGWFVGEKVTLADLAFLLYTTSWLEVINVVPDFDKHPKLKALKEKVQNLPALKQWLDDLPETRF